METSPTISALKGLHRALRLQEVAGLTDGQLLGCFLEERDEAAFAALVKRHGPMVWGVCHRLLGYQDAEDAFQATFLVLFRKAAAIVPRERVASYLYGVAHQTALHARRSTARRRARERQVMEMPEAEVVPQEIWHDLQPLLDQELSRLPDRYRSVILLCDLEGRTRKEAARQLGVPEGTVAGWIARARRMLARRLTQHGVTVTGGALATLLAQNAASAQVPAAVMSSTLRTTGLLISGQAAAGALSARAASLAEGVLKTMLLTKLKIATTLLVAVSLIVPATTLLGHKIAAGQASAIPSTEARRLPVEKDVGPSAPPGQNGKPARKASGDPEVRLLAGEWTVRRVETNGEGLLSEDGLREARITFTDDRARVKGLRVRFVRDFSFKLDSTRTPKAIDVCFLDGAKKGKIFEGIYVTRPDEVRICLRLEHPEYGRPSGFATSSGNTLYTFILERPGKDRVPPAPDRTAPAKPVRPGALASARTCSVTGSLISTEYARRDGTLDRAIVYVFTDPEDKQAAHADVKRRLGASTAEFTLDLPPGTYRIQCTGVGSRGATFVPMTKRLTIKPGDKVLDLGKIDLPASAITQLFGKPAPELDGVVGWKNTDGMTLKDLKGKVVVLDFWSYTCSICVHHKPDLARLAEKYKDQKLAVLTVHDHSVSTIVEMDRKLTDTAKRKIGRLPIALDGKGARGVFRAYGVHAVPTVILIDAEGKVVRRFHHAGDPELDREVARLLAKEPRGTKTER